MCHSIPESGRVFGGRPTHFGWLTWAASWACCRCQGTCRPLRRPTCCPPNSTHSALPAQRAQPSQVDGRPGHCSVCLYKLLPFLLKCSKYLPEKSTFAFLKNTHKKTPQALDSSSLYFPLLPLHF